MTFGATSPGLAAALPVGGWRARAAVLAALAVTCLLAWATLDTSSYKNDPLNRLGSGYDLGGGDADVHRLYAAAVENCRTHVEAGGKLAACINYQRVILLNIYFNYPITSLFGHSLQYGYGSGSFLDDVGHALAWAAVAGSLLASILALLILWPVAPAPLIAVALAFAAGELVQYLGGKSSLKLGAPAALHSMVTLAVFAAGAGLLAIALGRLHRAADPAIASPSPTTGRMASWLPWALVAIVALLFAGRASGLARGAFQVAALALFIGLFLIAAVQARIPTLVAVTMAVVMVGMVTHDYGLKLETPKQQAFLVFTAALVYATVRPRGRLVWLLPATLLFHASSAGLTAIAILAVELVLCLRRRRLSHLLGATLATAIPAAIFGLGSGGNPLISTSNSDLLAVLHRVAASGSLWPTVCIVLLLVGLASAILARREDQWDAVAFFALLLVEVVVAEAAASVVHKGDVLTDAFYLPAQAHKYFAAVNLGAVLGLLALLAQRSGVGDASSPLGTSSGRPWLVPALAVICLAIAQAPRLSVASNLKGVEGLAMLVPGTMPEKWLGLAPAAGENDDYFLGSGNPKNSAITYFSLLKMKVRKATGQFNSSAMRVLVLENGVQVGVPEP